MRVCNSCNKEFPHTSFRRRIYASGYYYLYSECKLCSKKKRKYNPLITKEANKRAYKKRREQFILKALKRDGRLRGEQSPKWNTKEELFLLSEAYSIAKLREQLSGGKWEVDHILPLNHKLVSGLHCIENLQVVIKKLNRSKGGNSTSIFKWSDNFKDMLCARQ